MSTLTANASNADGRLRSQSNTSFNAARVGDVIDVDTTNTTMSFVRWRSADAYDWVIVRSYYNFDSSALPADKIISSVVTSFHGAAAANPETGAYLMLGPTWGGAALATGDWEGDIAGTKAADSPVDPWVDNDWNNFTENATGIADVDDAGITYRALWEQEYDYADSGPGSDPTIAINVGVTTDAGGNIPKMYITYTSGTVTITALNGGENIDQGTKTTLTWTFTGTDIVNVKIDVSATGAAPWTELTPSTDADNVGAGSGSWVWNLEPAQTLTDTYKIQIIGVEHASVDTSDAAFTVSARSISTPNPPAASAEWGVGKTHDITFAYAGTGGEFTHVDVLYNDGSNHSIEADVALTGSPQTYSWVGIPDATAVGNDAITVIVQDSSADTGSTPVSGTSANFTIYKYDTLSAPAGTIYNNENNTVTWVTVPAAATGNATGDIEYSLTNAWGGEEVSIVAGTLNDGTHVWATGDITDASVWVRFTEDGGEAIYGTTSSFIITARPITPARAHVETALTINGVRQNVRDFRVTWDRDNGRSVSFTLPSSRRNERYTGKYAQFKHGHGSIYEGASFKGRVKSIRESSDATEIIAHDFSNDLRFEEHHRTGDKGMSGNSISGYIYELLNNSGTAYDLTNYGTGIVTRFDKITRDMVEDLKALDYKWDAIIYLLDQATNTDDWNAIVTYHLLNTRWDEMSIRAIPDLTGALLTVPPPGLVTLASDITIDQPITSARAHSTIDDTHSILYRPEWLEDERGVNFRKIEYPSRSPDRLWDASVRYVENRKKPQISFAIDVRKGFWIKPLMALDLNSIEEFGNSAYVTRVTYGSDLTARCDVNTRRPDMFDLLGL